MDRCRIPLICRGGGRWGHQVRDERSPYSPSLDNHVLLIDVHHWVRIDWFKMIASNRQVSSWKLPSPHWQSRGPHFPSAQLAEDSQLLFHDETRKPEDDKMEDAMLRRYAVR